MLKDSDQIVWIILNAARNTKIGKYKLAEFLKGSKAKDVANLSNQQGYGGLLWYDIPTIISFIEQLEEMDLLRRLTFHDYYSALELAEAGKKVLEEKIRIELQIIKKEKPLNIGDSEKITLKLFKEGKNIEEIAKERGLVISTIYDHLYKLVANGYLSSSEFIPEIIIKQILEAKNKLPNAAKLKEIKEMLPEDITYNEIRCVLAEKNMEKEVFKEK